LPVELMAPEFGLARKRISAVAAAHLSTSKNFHLIEQGLLLRVVSYLTQSGGKTGWADGFLAME